MPPTLWLTDEVLSEIYDLAAQAVPHETGGMLLGWRNEHTNDVAVCAQIGPGPKAQHAPTSFRPDGPWQQRQLRRQYREGGRIVTYLGDWHVHPEGALELSGEDTATMLRIARKRSSRTPRPVFGLLVTNAAGFQFAAWQLDASARPSRLEQLTIRAWNGRT